ncbi:GNAT family N-acetyltransferase [Candidatus Bathyarchaeota archaeon]|nr:GNAT family N-acetyltransferase [Candidatus Bathyarchaeota archaeon]
MTQQAPGKIEIVPIAEEHIESFHACLDSVARERRYLAGVEARPMESTREFVLNNIRCGHPQYVAVYADKVVGWCDIIPMRGIDFNHCGVLGMGVLKAYRGQGLGTSLLDTALDAAKKFGIERVELEVYTSNTVAIGLYVKRGFASEGVKRRARKLDGEYYDIQVMALFVNP